MEDTELALTDTPQLITAEKLVGPGAMEALRAAAVAGGMTPMAYVLHQLQLHEAVDVPGDPDASFAAPAGQPLTPADFRVTLTVERIGMSSTTAIPLATDAITVQEWAPWATAPEVRESITNAFRRAVVAVQGAWLS
jgi:hypothetical protein